MSELFEDGEVVPWVLFLCSSSTIPSRIPISLSLRGVVVLKVVKDGSIDLFKVSPPLRNMLKCCSVFAC